MTFSEFINKCSYSDYINYCNKHSLQPIFDMRLEVPKKLCWLVEPKEQTTINQNKRKHNEHIN
jgi:hypothetical protein